MIHKDERAICKICQQEGYQKTSWVFYIIALGAVAGNTLGIPLEGGAATFLFGFMFFYWTGMLHTKLTKGGSK